MIVATSYAVHPLKGSEDGMGWNFTQEIGKHYPITVYTRVNNVDLANEHNSNQNVIYKGFDLPYILRFWKRGQRGSLLYFYIWQLGIAFKIASEASKYSVAWNVNFHNDWTPTFLWVTGLKYIWGPVGHHPEIPKEFRFKDVSSMKEFFKRAVKKYFWSYSLTHLIARRKAHHILAMNSDAFSVMEEGSRSVSIESSVASHEKVYIDRIKSEEIRLLFVGRFVSLKGPMILIETLKKLEPNVKLVLIGRGPLEKDLRGKIQEYDLEQRVSILSWMPQHKVLEEYTKADLFFFPSFEGAGMVVTEALASGLPVVCFDNSGPGEIVGDSDLKVTLNGDMSVVTENFKNVINSYLIKSDAEKSEYRIKARSRFSMHYSWKIKGDHISKLLAEFF